MDGWQRSAAALVCAVGRGYIILCVSFLANFGLLSLVYPVSFGFRLMRRLIDVAFFFLPQLELFHAVFLVSQ